MATVGKVSRPSLPSLPTEILAHIASFLTPSLTRRWRPGDRSHQYYEWEEQHKTITALQLADRRFAEICRPLVWRSVCFSSEDDSCQKGPATLFQLKDVQPMVIELRWERDDSTYTDMAPLFLPFLTNLASLALHLDTENYNWPLVVPKSLTRSYVRLPRAAGGMRTGFPKKIMDLYFVEDREIDWENDDEATVLRQLPSLKHLTLDRYLAPLPPSSATIQGAPRFSEFLADELEGRYDEEMRATFPLETLTIAKIELFGSFEVVNLLRKLTPCPALRSLVFADCSFDETELLATWSSLQMETVRRLTIKFFEPPLSSLKFPLQSLLGAFPNLIELDTTNIAIRQARCAPLDTLNGLSLELQAILKVAAESTKLERLVLRFPESREILRCEKRGRGKELVSGFALELWRQWTCS
ncbi:hypothetical protein BCR35DRAFT_332378 [Leucosporidium creatinivorum]|uniref:F-box domain-containing protein n=1 Tax=Leucosporidium creatinivorum TaxID=106004 RepID=A0A1Y2F3E4_9BASI|nr:hypothetical protein BCR35DRAFT_332378 [Leucosporidium creatinivorum]